MADDRSPLLSLPPEVLHKLFQRLDQQTLTRLLPFVNKQLRQQALAACVDIHLDTGIKKSEHFAYFLAKQGHHLQSLSLATAASGTSHQLPFAEPAQLRSLSIHRGRFLPSPGKAFTALQQLRHLELESITANTCLLGELHVLTNLRSLQLNNVDWGPNISTASRRSIADGANRAWAALTCLTSVTLSRCDVDDAAVAQLSSSLAGNLQHLDLSGNALRSAAGLAPLPQGLTYLALRNNHSHFDVCELLASSSSYYGSSTAVGRQLQHFEISGLTLMQPSQLTALTALTHFVADRLQMPEEGCDQLLAAMASMQQLQHLQLQASFAVGRRHVRIPALEAALQQLGKLTYLDLRHNRMLYPPYHGGDGQNPEQPPLLLNCQLPKLQVLLLDCQDGPYSAGHDYNYLMRPKDIGQLSLSCPNLQQLDLLGRISGADNSTVTSTDILPLTKLSGTLTSLALSSGSRSFWGADDGVLKTLVHLSGLRCLVLGNADHVSDVGLMVLTKLRQLNKLHVTDLDPLLVSKQVAPRQHDDDGELYLFLQTKGNKQPNVWQQLQQRCNQSTSCLRLRQKELEQELHAAQREARAERKRAAAAQKDAAAAQEQIAALRQQLAALQAASSSQGSQ